MQNDLDELYAVVSFVAPGYLGKYSHIEFQLGTMEYLCSIFAGYIVRMIVRWAQCCIRVYFFHFLDISLLF